MASAEVAPPPAETKGKKASSTPKGAKRTAAKKPKADPLHPTYLQMISEAILALKERTGSSQIAITKQIESKYKDALPDNFKKIVLVQLRNLVKQNKLVKVKGSFKLSEDLKKRVAPKLVSQEKEKKAKKAAPSAEKAAPKKARSTKSPKKAVPLTKKAAPKVVKPAKSASSKKMTPAKKPAAKKPAAKKPAASKSAPKPKAPAKSAPKKAPARPKPAAKSPKTKKSTAKRAKKA